MKLQDPTIRELLAAEYVLGTLHGRARRRFERFLRDDPVLRARVAYWEERMVTVSENKLPSVIPPRETLQSILDQLGLRENGKAERKRPFAFWRGLAIASTACAMLLLAYIGLVRDPVAEPAYFAVLADASARPAMLVTSLPDGREIRIDSVSVDAIPHDSALELWLLPGGNRPPVSLGLVSATGSTTVGLPRAAQADWAGGKGLAISQEPPGGSPTGLPTGPILYQGQLVVRSSAA